MLLPCCPAAVQHGVLLICSYCCTAVQNSQLAYLLYARAAGNSFSRMVVPAVVNLCALVHGRQNNLFFLYECWMMVIHFFFFIAVGAGDNAAPGIIYSGVYIYYIQVQRFRKGCIFFLAPSTLQLYSYVVSIYTPVFTSCVQQLSVISTYLVPGYRLVYAVFFMAVKLNDTRSCLTRPFHPLSTALLLPRH